MAQVNFTYLEKQNLLRASTRGGAKVTVAVNTNDWNELFNRLEAKCATVCPQDKRLELIQQIENKKDGTVSQTHWTDGLDVPQWYETATKTDIQSALEYGSQFVCKCKEQMEQGAEDVITGQAIQKWKSKLEEEQAKARHDKQNAEEVMQQLKNSMEERLDQERQSARNEIDALRERAKAEKKFFEDLVDTFKKREQTMMEEERAKAQRELDALREKSKLEKAIADDIITNLKMVTMGMDTKWIAEKDEMVKNFKQDRDTSLKQFQGEKDATQQTITLLRQMIEEQNGEKQRLLQEVAEERKRGEQERDIRVQKTIAMTNASYKGRDGEHDAYQLLRTAFNDVELEWTRHMAGKMDMVMMYDGLKIGLEVKNNETPLRSDKGRDLDKFWTNLHDNPDYDIGIVMALKTHCPNYAKNWIEVEVRNNKQIAVYMNYLTENPIERLQMLIGTVFKPWKAYLELRRQAEELMKGDALKEWSDQAREILQEGWEAMMRLIKEWGEFRSKLMGLADSYEDSLHSNVEDFCARLGELDINVDAPQRKKTRPSRRR